MNSRRGIRNAYLPDCRRPTNALCGCPLPMSVMDELENFVKVLGLVYKPLAISGPCALKHQKTTHCLHKIENDLHLSIRTFDNETYIYLRTYTKSHDSQLHPTEKAVYMSLNGFLKVCLYTMPEIHETFQHPIRAYEVGRYGTAV